MKSDEIEMLDTSISCLKGRAPDGDVIPRQTRAVTENTLLCDESQ